MTRTRTLTKTTKIWTSRWCLWWIRAWSWSQALWVFTLPNQQPVFSRRSMHSHNRWEINNCATHDILSDAFEKVHVGPDELSMWGDLGEKMIVLSAESDQHMKVWFLICWLIYVLKILYVCNLFVCISNICLIWQRLKFSPGSGIDGKKFEATMPNDWFAGDTSLESSSLFRHCHHQ